MKNTFRITSWYEPGGIIPIAYETILESTIRKKAQNQRVRNIVEERMGIAPEPGHGPANLLREYLGSKTPKWAEGASSYGPGAYPKWVRRPPTSREIEHRERKQKNMGIAASPIYNNYFSSGGRSRRTRRRCKKRQ